MGLFSPKKDTIEQLKEALREEIYQEVVDTITEQVKAQERTKWKDSGDTLVIYQIKQDATTIIPRFTISKDCIHGLVESGYINAELAEDDEAVKLALILLTNEVSEQILEEKLEELNSLVQ